MPRAQMAFAKDVLGPCLVERDCTWEHRLSAVLRLRDAHGTAWFLKRHRERERYLTEVAAYGRWVPALGDRAPRLRACDDASQSMILSAVPGEPPPWPAATTDQPGQLARLAELVVQREAGEHLRRLHEAQPATPGPDLGAAKLAELDQFMPAARKLLTAGELAFVRAEVAGLAGIASDLVPCHRDYTPRNWLAGDGGLYVIDFEWARLDPWASDLVRLDLGVWAGRPDLREAFLAGYGRRLDDTDRAVLRGCGALTTVWMITRARMAGVPVFENAMRANLRRLMAEAV